MNNQPIDTQDAESVAIIYPKNKLGLPLLALGLDFVPLLLIFSASIGRRFSLSSFMLLFIVLSPIAGLITGVVSLSWGKNRIGLLGKIIAIIAIILPLSLVALTIMFFIGAATGIISLM